MKKAITTLLLSLVTVLCLTAVAWATLPNPPAPTEAELLALTDLHNLIACRHECFYFRAGIQLGISLGSIAVLSGDMPD